MIPVSRSFVPFVLASFVSVIGACGSDEEPPPAEPPACSVEAQSGCAVGQVCEKVEGGAKPTACYQPVTVEGKVVKAADGTTGIGGARVVARDVNGALVSREIAVSAADGVFKLTFPTTRKADGTPTVGQFALRADAAGYATFPGGLRIAVPVDVATPVKNPDGSYVIKNGTTTVGLDALENATGLGTVSGTVKADKPAGTLVVAGGASGIAAPDGTYTVFNVPAASQEVRGYLQGLQLKPATVTVAAGAESKGVDLLADTAALATVSGNLGFVNTGGADAKTTVVLVVKSTFNATIARGEVPRGLRADVTGAYVIKDVPAGQYVVLAAFENDGLVRDPDLGIGGTATQEITVGNAPVTVEAFKITGALAVISPGANGPEPVPNATPTFNWQDDSSEEGYEVRVYNTFGKQIWEKLDVAGHSGSGNPSTVYAGPALTPGYYQFRVWSWATKGGGGGKVYRSVSEDLKGVFIVK